METFEYDVSQVLGISLDVLLSEDVAEYKAHMVQFKNKMLEIMPNVTVDIADNVIRNVNTTGACNFPSGSGLG